MSTSMTVLLPQQSPSLDPRGHDEPVTFPTLYLLHGLSDDHTMWLRRTSLERYVAPLGLAVVMPQVHRSFYCDEAHGKRYWTFLSEELPTIASRFFPLSPRRGDSFVAGFSMGGYGAVKWALRQPTRFAAAASLSGSLGLAGRLHPDSTNRLDARLWDTIFDNKTIDQTPDDVVWLLGRTPPDELPALYVACGSEDALYEESLRFRDAARRHGISLTEDFGPGAHTWDYWDAKIQDVLDWLPLKDPVVPVVDH